MRVPYEEGGGVAEGGCGEDERGEEREGEGGGAHSGGGETMETARGSDMTRIMEGTARLEWESLAPCEAKSLTPIPCRRARCKRRELPCAAGM